MKLVQSLFLLLLIPVFLLNPYPATGQVPEDVIEDGKIGLGVPIYILQQLTGIQSTHPYDIDDDGDSYTENQGDCDDSDPGRNPEAPELCGDDIDHDCDGYMLCPEDIDNDGDGITENQGDCDDANKDIYPGADEICGDGIDQDCIDGDLICPGDIDNDGDGMTPNQGDCDDTDPMTNPNALDFCGDGIDQDCNGTDLVCLSPEFYGGWKMADNSAEEFVFLTIFSDGVYMLGQNSGMEFGTLSLEPETDILSVHTVYDQNGDNGLSSLPPGTTMTVSGDTLTFMIPGEGSGEFTRVVDISNPIIGTWHWGSAEHQIGSITSLTIYDNSTYIYSEYESGNPENAGLEFGTYTYENGEITLTVVVDQNGDSGTSSINGVPLPVVINGDEMTVTIPDGGDEVFYRVN